MLITLVINKITTTVAGKPVVRLVLAGYRLSNPLSHPTPRPKKGGQTPNPINS